MGRRIYILFWLALIFIVFLMPESAEVKNWIYWLWQDIRNLLPIPQGLFSIAIP